MKCAEIEAPYWSESDGIEMGKMCAHCRILVGKNNCIVPHTPDCIVRTIQEAKR